MYSSMQNNFYYPFNYSQNPWLNNSYFAQQMNFGYQPFQNPYFNYVQPDTSSNDTKDSSKNKTDSSKQHYSYYSASEKIKDSKEDKDPSEFLEYFLKSAGVIVAAAGAIYAGKGAYKLVKNGFSKLGSFLKPKTSTT